MAKAYEFEESLYDPKASSLKEFASSSSLHGLGHVVSDGRCTLRCFFWTAAFLGSLSFLFCHCFESMCYYLEYHHVTKVDNIQAPFMYFPAVTLCNLNQARFFKLNKCDVLHAGIWLSVLDESFEFHGSDLVNRSYLERLLNLTAMMTEEEEEHCRDYKFNWTEFYDRTSYNLTEMLKSCKFQKQKCTADDFQPVSTLP
ncbi:Acid-sensing ion channel 1 [Acipenser ruthenus]|uniref:Acid-sensing ion channel 1 n=1 Tax=Acipenser ruthenus TaxID=7906 RepID=A0A662YVZ1_ACIRT|nr:Acid-sensing ion channel 1 [Acipenser ruthenus]